MSKKDSPIKILVNLYSVVAGLALITAVKNTVSPHETIIRSPFEIPIIDLLGFFTFLSWIIPFYQGAITYLHETYGDNYHGKKGEILVDFIHLLLEGMVFYAISISLLNIMLVIAWLGVLVLIDSIWIGLIKLRKKEKTTPDVWLILNLITLIIIFIIWMLNSVYPNIATGIEGYAILFFFSMVRTIYDYLHSQKYYFE